MKFTIYEKPIPKARHRHNGKFSYDPQDKEKKHIISFLESSLSEMANTFNTEILKEISEVASAESFHIHMKFYFTPNESDSEAVKNLKLWGFIKHTTKPDCSNLAKFYEDCMNSIVFHDDSMINKLVVEKEFSHIAKVEIEIMPKKTVSIPCQTEEFLKIFSPTDLALLLQNIQILSEKYDTEKDILELPDSQKYLWLVDMSKDMLSFAEKFSDKLSKLKNKNKASGIGKTLS